MAQANLIRLGIANDLYTGIITSGEAAFDYLATSSPWGKTYLYIGPEKDRTLLNGLSYTETTSVEEAQFVICTGFDHDDSTLAEKLPALQAALIRKLPLICANPDMEIVRITGKRALCAGVMAEWYEENGGNTYYFGKPYKIIYDMALAVYKLHPENTFAIGDNLNTDIKGANNAGIRSVLVTGGVLNEEIQKGHKIEDICKDNGNIPTYLIPAFR